MKAIRVANQSEFRIIPEKVVKEIVIVTDGRSRFLVKVLCDAGTVGSSWDFSAREDAERFAINLTAALDWVTVDPFDLNSQGPPPNPYD